MLQASDPYFELTLAYQDSIEIVNVASVPHRSPFRYAGGKTWFVPHARRWLRSLVQPPKALVEPFAGGAIVSLTAVFEGLCENAILVELDPDVASVWHSVCSGDALRLGEDICVFDLSLDNVRRVLSAEPQSTYQRAFATILKNRINRGGILAPGAGIVKNGENNRGLASRWYPTTLRRRFADLHAIRHRLRVEQRDGFHAIDDYGAFSDCALFVDPPYTIAGQRLYAYPDIDHAELFRRLSTATANFIATYDDTDSIRGLSRSQGLDFTVVPMKTTHHTKKLELVIGRDIGWLRGSPAC